MGYWNSWKIAYQCAATISSALSLIGCSIIWKRLINLSKKEIGDRLLLGLMVSDIIQSFFYGIGAAGELNAGFCQFQGLMIVSASISSMLIAVQLTYVMYSWVKEGKHPKKSAKQLNRILQLSFIVPFMIAIIFLGVGLLGTGNIWCTVATEHELARFLYLDGVLIICWITVISLLVLTVRSLQYRKVNTPLDEKVVYILNYNQRQLEERMRLFILIFI